MEDNGTLKLLIEGLLCKEAKLNVKLIRNGKGSYTWELTVIGAKNVNEATGLLFDAEQYLRKTYGE